MEPFAPFPADNSARPRDVRLSETRGWTEREVELRFGEPLRRGREPIPGGFADGAPLDVWEYRTARGERWLLYFDRSADAPPPPSGLVAALSGSSAPRADEKRVVKVWYFEAEARR